MPKCQGFYPESNRLNLLRYELLRNATRKDLKDVDACKFTRVSNDQGVGYCDEMAEIMIMILKINLVKWFRNGFKSQNFSSPHSVSDGNT